MNFSLNRRDILKKTVQIGGMTLLSRFLGIIREILIARFFGVGTISDAFIVSFRLPNFFRHIFAEGAMSASFVPAFVKSVKEGDRREASGLMSVSFLFFESVIFLIYIFILFKTEFVVKLLAPGFSQEQSSYAVPFLQMLFPFLFLVSSSTLFAGALQAVNCFAIPAFGPVLWNIFYVLSLIVGLSFGTSPFVVCIGILLGGFFWMLMNIFFYLQYKFSFGYINSNVLQIFKNVLKKFLPCLFGVSIVEFNLFVSSIIASFLPKGSVTLLYFGSRFMNIPLGVFAVGFSNVMLSHFSRLVLYAPKRLNFYVLEVTKFISWIIIPTTLFFMFISHYLFSDIMLSKVKDVALINQGAWILVIYLSGLLFFCLNKTLLSIFYAVKDTTSIMISSSVSAIVNVIGDLLGIMLFGSYGIAGAASLSGAIMTLLCFYFLYKKHNFKFYVLNYLNFLFRYLLQLFIVITVCFIFYYLLRDLVVIKFFAGKIWRWVGLLGGGVVIFLLIFFTRKLFGYRLYFLDH